MRFRALSVTLKLSHQLKLSKFFTPALIITVSGVLSLFGTGCFLQGGHVDKRVVALPAIYDPQLKIGTAAHALLSEEVFNELVVEIQPVGDFAPAPASLENLRTFLIQHLAKSGGITYQTNAALPASGIDHYTIADVRRLESRNRKNYAKDKRISVFILFADGSSVTDEEKQKLLGHAHLSTSIVIYEKTIQDIAWDPAEAPRINLETAILEHEFSHLLGLVDNGSPEQSQHRDLDHRYHCNNPECLMHYSLGSVEVGPALSKVPTLDQACEDDLRANGGKTVIIPPVVVPEPSPEPTAPPVFP